MPDHANESMTIKADPATIMGVIADFPSYPQWAGPVKQIEVLEEGPDGRAKSVRFHVEVMGLADLYVNDRAPRPTKRAGRGLPRLLGRA